MVWKFGKYCLLILVASPLWAEPSDVSAICDASSAAAAAERGIPADVLYSITLIETGRMRGGRLQPWPWTVNMEGKGFWFDSRAEAMAYVQEKFDAGARSFDVGCFQINYKWHNQNFDSLEQMFDPMANARYSAKFMTELFDESANWTKAAGMYHSRNEQFASGYRSRFDRIRATLGALPAAPALVLPTVLVTRFPGVRHAFLSGPPMAAGSPYASNQVENMPETIVPIAVLGSLASGMLGGETVTLLTATSGALF